MTFVLIHPSENSYAQVVYWDKGARENKHFDIRHNDWGKLGGYMGRRHCWTHIMLNWRVICDERVLGLVISDLHGHINVFFEGFKHVRGVVALSMNACPGE